MAHILSNSLYGSLYKHVNNAAASGTPEGYHQAGQYIRIGLILNTIMTIPVSIILIFFMHDFIGLFGYGERVTNLAQGYTIIAVFKKFIETSSSFITMIMDIEDRADFDAMYDFVDHGVDAILLFVVIPLMKPSLVQFGLLQLSHDIISTIVYYCITWIWYGWFSKYKGGIFSPASFKVSFSFIYVMT